MPDIHSVLPEILGPAGALVLAVMAVIILLAGIKMLMDYYHKANVEHFNTLREESKECRADNRELNNKICQLYHLVPPPGSNGGAL